MPQLMPLYWYISIVMIIIIMMMVLELFLSCNNAEVKMISLWNFINKGVWMW